VYYDLSPEDAESDVAAVVEVNQLWFERCVTRCCCLGAGGGGADNPADSRKDAIPDMPDTCSRRRFSDNLAAEAKKSPTTPASAVPSASQTINVDQFGYSLIKTMDVGSVRFLVAHSNPRDRPGCPSASNPAPHFIVAFRGTANARNAIIDANFVRTSWAEMQRATKGCAKVHNGFANAWADILPHLKQILELALGQFPQTKHIVCTGHSLGGAIATLCSYSLEAGALAGTRLDCAVSCYTFGAPRIGNQSFVRQYNLACRGTFRVVNENDVVVWIGHCGREHSGHGVFINRDGDTVVEGNFLEGLYRPVIGNGSSLNNHLLGRYGNSIDNVLCPRNLAVDGTVLATFVALARREEAQSTAGKAAVTVGAA
jgi:hypothetical protein